MFDMVWEIEKWSDGCGCGVAGCQEIEIAENFRKKWASAREFKCTSLVGTIGRLFCWVKYFTIVN
jgi:hypothetical protein